MWPEIGYQARDSASGFGLWRAHATERGRHQLGINVFGDFLELASGKAENEAVGVVVRLPVGGLVIATGLHHDVVVFRDEPVRRGPNSAVNPGTQRSKQILEHRF